MVTADKVMEEMLATFRQRASVYGDNYLRIGPVLEAMFPGGITLRTADDHNRYHLYLMMMVKMTRLATTNIAHEDSALDAAVYSAMLKGVLAP